jgi:hypothetical protein
VLQNQAETVTVRAVEVERHWVRGRLGGGPGVDLDLKLSYVRLGLKLQHAGNSVEAGILRLYQQLSDGTLKIFNTCTQLLADLRYYHCNERGQVVKRQDHLVDALRYAVMAGPLYAKTKPKPPQEISMVAPHRPWSWG